MKSANFKKSPTHANGLFVISVSHKDEAKSGRDYYMVLDAVMF